MKDDKLYLIHIWECIQCIEFIGKTFRNKQDSQCQCHQEHHDLVGGTGFLIFRTAITGDSFFDFHLSSLVGECCQPGISERSRFPGHR